MCRVRASRFILVQISDSHVTADGRLFGRLDAIARVHAVFAILEGAGVRPDVIVLSGDQADRGEAAAYRRLRPVIESGVRSLGARLLVIPGNHDDRRLLRSSLLGLPAGDDPMDSVLRVGDLRVIGLDSSVPDGDHGELDDEQLDWLSRELRQPAPAGTILVIHHPPIWSTTPVSELVALRAPERLADAIRGRDVRLILSGHTHRVSAGTLADVPVWVSPATASNADSLASGGFRGHAGGGFTRIDVLDDGEIVTTLIPLTGRDEILYDVAVDDVGP